VSMTPVRILSDVPSSSKSVAMVAVQGYEKYAVPVEYWPEIKAQYGATLAAKAIAKDAAITSPALLAAAITKQQDALVEADDATKPFIQQAINELGVLKAIVDADGPQRIDDFYDSLIASLAPDDYRIVQYREEQATAKTSLVPAITLPDSF
jgi:hypothetical protein